MQKQIGDVLINFIKICAKGVSNVGKHSANRDSIATGSLVLGYNSVFAVL